MYTNSNDKGFHVSMHVPNSTHINPKYTGLREYEYSPLVRSTVYLECLAMKLWCVFISLADSMNTMAPTMINTIP